MTAAATPDLDWLFAGEPQPTAPIYVDRSNLERYATCPAQGHLHDLGLCLAQSPDADAGNAVHDAIGEAIHAFIDGEVSTSALNEIMQGAVRQSRPDIQAHAVEGIRRSAWAIASRVLYQDNGDPRHSDDIMRHDGGRGHRSGQLAQEVGTLGDRPVLLTSEIDLLMATISDEEVEEWDWKSGRKLWSATDLRESFQFGTFHPWLIFANYPRVQRVHIRAWSTRFNKTTGRVTFDRRSDLSLMTERVNAAFALWAEHRPGSGATADRVPAWPGLKKCSECDVATQCPEARSPVREVVSNPGAAAAQLVALEASAKRLKASLTAHADQHGRIELPDGSWFGRDEEVKAPSRKPSAKWHKAQDEAQDDSEGASDG